VLFNKVVFAVLNVFVDWAHNIPNFEPNSAHFNQVALAKSVARELHVWLVSRFHHLPNLLFWLLFKHLVNFFVNQLLVENPVSVVTIKEAHNYLFLLGSSESELGIFKVFSVYSSYGYFRLRPAETLIPFEPMVNDLDFSAFKVIEAVRLAGPRVSSNFKTRDIGE